MPWSLAIVPDFSFTKAASAKHVQRRPASSCVEDWTSAVPLVRCTLQPADALRDECCSKARRSARWHVFCAEAAVPAMCCLGPARRRHGYAWNRKVAGRVMIKRDYLSGSSLLPRHQDGRCGSISASIPVDVIDTPCGERALSVDAYTALPCKIGTVVCFR
jgi:hypothetical protein